VLIKKDLKIPNNQLEDENEKNKFIWKQIARAAYDRQIHRAYFNLSGV
jgi:hypothetical protein